MIQKTNQLSLQQIDTSFDFTTDCRYWPGKWDEEGLFFLGKVDPDTASNTLKQYHQQLWSKRLPDDRELILEPGGQYDYLNTPDGMRLSSDTIVTSLMHGRMAGVLKEVRERVDWKSWLEATLRKMYTIGGSIIFPRHKNSINGQRGMNPFICDRWDLTLECIRRYYDGITDRDNNPIGWVLESDKPFFDLFVDFKGYCDFFFLQDCVTDDYSTVKMWIPADPFVKKYPYPSTADEYFNWIDKCLSFVACRNNRINEYVAGDFS